MNAIDAAVRAEYANKLELIRRQLYGLRFIGSAPISRPFAFFIARRIADYASRELEMEAIVDRVEKVNAAVAKMNEIDDPNRNEEPPPDDIAQELLQLRNLKPTPARVFA